MTSTINNPVFSIITPTFRRPEMLSRNIRSVLAQTFGNFEQIIVDDANDLVTNTIVESFGDGRLVLLKHDRPKGAAAAYNTGMKASRGEFIAFLDDDDEYRPEFLEKMNNQFCTLSPEIGFIWSGIERVIDYDDGRERVLMKVKWPYHFTDFEDGIAAATSIGNGFGLCLRQICIDQVGFYDEKLTVAEDTDFLIRLALKYKFRTIPEILVRIHAHERSQLTGKQNFDVRIEGKEIILKRYEDTLYQYPKVFMAHYLGYASLCYESGMKQKGRKAMLKVMGKNPLSLIRCIDFIALEISGKTIGSTILGLMLKNALNKLRQN